MVSGILINSLLPILGLEYYLTLSKVLLPLSCLEFSWAYLLCTSFFKSYFPVKQIFSDLVVSTAYPYHVNWNHPFVWNCPQVLVAPLIMLRECIHIIISPKMSDFHDIRIDQQTRKFQKQKISEWEKVRGVGTYFWKQENGCQSLVENKARYKNKSTDKKF